ncbi:hypothetical protein ACUW6F_001250 [Staphylococcus saprophyticus]
MMLISRCTLPNSTAVRSGDRGDLWHGMLV